MKILAFLTNSSGGISIPAVANYSALIANYPPPNSAHLGQYVFCQNSQGTWWVPGPILGTYYPAGVYYCNGVDWKYTNVPYQATQAEVDTGTATDVFVSPATFNNASKWSNYAPIAQGLPSGGTAGQILAKIDATNYNTQWIDNFTPTVKHIVKAGEALTKGQAVYISTADGTNMIAMKASNTSEATSAQTIGIIAQDLALNQTGYVITEGLLAGTGPAPLNTNSGNDGDPIYLGVNGALIFGVANKPVAPAHLVYLGVITRKQPINGEIFVKVQNGYELEELHNVDAINPSNNDGLFYNTTTSLWEHKSIATALGYTPQTQFLSKLVFKEVFGGTTSSTSETILATFTILANELPNQTTLYFETLAYKTAAIVNGSFRIRVNTSNTLVGATQLAQWGMGGNTSLHSQARRRFGLTGGNIYAYPALVPQNTDIIISTSAETVVAADVTNALYFFITFTANSSADTLNHVFSLMKNF